MKTLRYAVLFVAASAVAIPPPLCEWPSRSRAFGREPEQLPEISGKVRTVIQRVERACRERKVYMIGPQKAKRLAELVRKKRPQRVVECGTAIGYSGLWIAGQLQANGAGKLVTIEIDPDRAREARRNFREAGLADYVEVRIGDASQVVKQIKGPIDFVFIDCGFGNYAPCFAGLESKLSEGAIVVADNVGIGASGMKDYLDRVRAKHRSHTEWFDLDLPWATRDAMEITVVGSTAGD